MRIIMEQTEKFVIVRGVRTRVWEGTTELGVPCQVLVHGVLVDCELPSESFEEFKQDLEEAPGRIHVTVLDVDLN